ncbi:MAG: hypothetical protein LBI34_02810 [Puniceicoccales bacterium]|jgi:hypothetical protein|nr:hypothetical protein [Puniceicoccales bacterium]
MCTVPGLQPLGGVAAPNIAPQQPVTFQDECMDVFRQQGINRGEITFISPANGKNSAQCVGALRDICRTQTGLAVFKEIATNARSLRIDFSLQNLSSRIDCTATMDFSVLISLDDYNTGHIPFLVKIGNGDLSKFGFVAVRYPPSLVLEHELGHGRQCMLVGKDANDTRDTLRPVRNCLFSDAAETVIGYTCMFELRGLLTPVPDAVNPLVHIVGKLYDKEKNGELTPSQKDVFNAASLIMSEWNDEHLLETLNILPFACPGRPAISDGIFLQELLSLGNLSNDPAIVGGNIRHVFNGKVAQR